MPPKRKNISLLPFIACADGELQAELVTRTRLAASHTLESLLALSHEDLAKHAFNLQVQLSALQQSGSGASPGEVWSEEKIAERAKKTRDVCAAEIKKQMKWQPSCKKGSTKRSYTGIVPHEDVFYKLFGFEKPKKPWEQEKIDMNDFENSIDHISASIRYGSLRLTGDGVKVNWDQDEKTFKLSGTYGL
ncbi:hypothetical protein E4T50_11489 [Aureobasidium sp. EXF-12298]|nr:hypothetical protein E4T50_11489 [Aureobasidium sp. EXF-12298]KAI4756883.1 hypothetical protein E4T51_10067 [Aureobasidium sp. EXF-12344]KAI4773874.1 hypothetical protein E4T52_11174 [Aureobasidium sp. EXF-3400]